MNQAIQENPHLGDLATVMESSLKLVHYVCKQYLKKTAHMNIPYEDLYSMGCMGLLKAYRAFDAERGVKFSTYAVSSIDGEIRHSLRDWEAGAHYPRRIRLNFYKILGKRMAQYSCKEIAEKLDMPIVEVEAAMDFGRNARPRNLEEQLDAKFTEGEQPCLADTIPQYEDFTTVYIQEFYASLSARDAEIARMYYEQDFGQREIGEYFDMSQAHISRILRSVKQKASKFFIEDVS